MIADKMSSQYQKYGKMLEGTTYEKEGNRVFFYDPLDDIDTYSKTCFMTDEELQYINEQRTGKSLTNQHGEPCKYIKRLARAQSGFVPCKDQAQKIAIERKNFPEGGNFGIEEMCKIIKSISNKSFEKPFYMTEKIEMEVG